MKREIFLKNENEYKLKYFTFIYVCITYPTLYWTNSASPTIQKQHFLFGKCLKLDFQYLSVNWKFDVISTNVVK